MAYGSKHLGSKHFTPKQFGTSDSTSMSGTAIGQADVSARATGPGAIPVPEPTPVRSGGGSGTGRGRKNPNLRVRFPEPTVFIPFTTEPGHLSGSSSGVAVASAKTQHVVQARAQASGAADAAASVFTVMSIGGVGSGFSRCSAAASLDMKRVRVVENNLRILLLAA